MYYISYCMLCTYACICIYSTYTYHSLAGHFPVCFHGLDNDVSSPILPSQTFGELLCY